LISVEKYISWLLHSASNVKDTVSRWDELDIDLRLTYTHSVEELCDHCMECYSRATKEQKLVIKEAVKPFHDPLAVKVFNCSFPTFEEDDEKNIPNLE